MKPGDPAAAPLVISGPASALALADDLARLMDDMQTRKVPWAALDTLVPEAASTNTGSSRSTSSRSRATRGPRSSQEIGRIEPAARRDLLIAAETAAPGDASRQDR